MKKVTSLLLLVGVAAFGLVGCDDDGPTPPPEPEIRGVSVTPSTLNIGVGETAPLTADVDGDANNSVTWSSNNTAVATVDDAGNVTGVAEGTAAVRATSTVDNSQSASATVNVTALEQAQVSIQSVANADGNGSVPDDVQGRIFVTVNLDEGDKSIGNVEVYFENSDGTRVLAGTQQFSSASQVEGTQAQGGVATLEFNINTARAEGALDGSVRSGRFGNGLQSVIAVANLGDGSTVEATWNEQLTFNNQDRIQVTAYEVGGNGLLNPDGTVRYRGGMDLVFAATPVIYTQGLTVGSISVRGQSDGGTVNIDGDGPHVDLGNGHGTAMQDSEAPFRFTAAYDDNVGSVEDDAADAGHTLSVTAVRDAEGAVVGGEFDLIALSGFYIDDTGPATGGSVQADFSDGNVAVGGAVFHPAGGVFTLPGVSDAGVGPTDYTADETDLSVIDALAEADGDTLAQDIDETGDLDEMRHDDADNGGYIGDLNTVMDLLGNEGDETGVGDTGDFGVDTGAPTFADVAPNDATFVFNGDASAAENFVIFTSEDPDLANGDAGAGVDTDAVTAEVVNSTAADTVDRTAALGGDLDNTNAPDYTLDVSSGTGTALGDGAYVINVASPDLAVPAPFANTGEQTIEFILDTTPPSFGALDPAPGNVSTGATSVIQTIGGTVTDANVIASATVTVRVTSATGIGDHDDGDASDGAPDADDVCETTDELLDVDNGDVVNPNVRDITNDTNSIDFEESFQISDPFPAGSGTVKYCYFVNATDEALDNTGAADGNSAAIQTSASVEWTN